MSDAATTTSATVRDIPVENMDAENMIMKATAAADIVSKRLISYRKTAHFLLKFLINKSYCPIYLIYAKIELICAFRYIKL